MGHPNAIYIILVTPHRRPGTDIVTKLSLVPGSNTRGNRILLLPLFTIRSLRCATKEKMSQQNRTDLKEKEENNKYGQQKTRYDNGAFNWKKAEVQRKYPEWITS